MSGLRDKLRRIYEDGHRHELPGLRSDARFAPSGEIRAAAVMIAVTDRPDPGVILTHRPTAMRQHAGQIAFPGGKIDPGEDAVQAALRETWEELGIEPEEIDVIGATDRFVTGTGYDITPVMGWVRADLPVIPNPAEVADWFEAPLRFLLDPANLVRKQMTYRGLLRDYTEIEWQGNRIWGVTAAILENLANRLSWQDLLDD